VEVLGWHWLRNDRKLRYPPCSLVTVGTTLSNPINSRGQAGPLEICLRGYHASERILDALGHAPGTILCRVKLHGEVLKTHDKMVADNRTCLWMTDATNILHDFACWVGEYILEYEQAQGRRHPKLWTAIITKRRWLDGKATEEEVR
jgi:hypothetical protein